MNHPSRRSFIQTLFASFSAFFVPKPKATSFRAIEKHASAPVYPEFGYAYVKPRSDCSIIKRIKERVREEMWRLSRPLSEREIDDFAWTIIFADDYRLAGRKKLIEFGVEDKSSKFSC